MKLTWMREYRQVVEALIQYSNLYAAGYHKEQPHGTDIPLSFAQIQVLEYLLENEELNQNMSTIALRLGISSSTFSKLISKLAAKGLLEKHHIPGNMKNIIIRVTDLGQEVYRRYVETFVPGFFDKMFETADQIPKEYLPVIAKFLVAGLEQAPEEEKKPS